MRVSSFWVGMRSRTSSQVRSTKAPELAAMEILMKYTLALIIGIVPFQLHADFNDVLSTYQSCSEAATRTVLPKQKVIACMDNYQLLLLHFAGVTLQEYKGMSVSQQGEVNRTGYQFFKEWQTHRTGY